jgi:uncharacterized protein (TIGR03067 family)
VGKQRCWKQFQILPEPKPKPTSKPEGVWIAEKVTSSGEVVPKEKFPFELDFEKGNLVFRFVGPVKGNDRVHKIVMDDSKIPATIDITSEDPRRKGTVRAIYKFDDERLLIYSLRDKNGQPAETRPADFGSGEEAGSDLPVLTRKPAPQE